jgi:hypothetical protein
MFLIVQLHISYYAHHSVTYCFSDENTSDSESEAHLTETEDAKGNKIINGITTTIEGKCNGFLSDLGESFNWWDYKLEILGILWRMCIFIYYHILFTVGRPDFYHYNPRGPSQLYHVISMFSIVFISQNVCLCKVLSESSWTVVTTSVKEDERGGQGHTFASLLEQSAM